MAELSREHIFGIPYVVADLETLGSALVQEAMDGRHVRLVAHSDVHVLTRIMEGGEYGEGLFHFDYICPDGMPIVWLMRRKGAAAHRLCGSDTMATMFKLGNAAGVRHFLLGGSEEVCAKLKENMEKLYPGVQIVGHYCPPMGVWPDGTNERMMQMVHDSGANCVWVGLGCPKQERWLYTHRAQLPPAVYFGVGAAFDFHAGSVRQAPRWMQSHGLEWLYRIYREPRRLFRRYLTHNSKFFWYCLTKKI